MLNSDKRNLCLEYPGCLWGEPVREFTHYFNRSVLYTQMVANCEECLKTLFVESYRLTGV